jgi:AhpD family alkylhydroperoxidase
MMLDEHILRLIAVGASVTANCQPCLQINVAQALECGVNGQEIAEAIEVGKMVRKGAAAKMDQLILTLAQVAPLTTGGCGCAT